ncbi:2-aminoethylphosphonate aminotransferase [Reichenbachiella ulvae]|uniref:2-aminoethylphosphonate--pyruvate transaminase n=1 Tax=Reichenbachiella ulvae TaxID=2980104 RepID=A0ABT3CU92_9BACT|nr:2-aminoethylphosphonate--pyruvate transaminase [Reichenbachiella ulvae]MCV9387243.1 2-aminoethylphosphonate--pyruvate transaminase [Reichenbachiella ulvae]
MLGKLTHQKSIKRNILLNPGPATTSKRVKEAMIIEDICPRESEFGDLMHQICDGILEIGNGLETHEVGLFVASGTGAMEATLVSALGDDDRVLIVTNGAYGLRMEAICKSYGLEYDTAFSFGDYPEAAKVKKVLEDGQFTHLAMIHHETSTGMMNPLEEIAEVCKERDVKLIVDAMSSYGAYPIDLKKTPLDYIFSSSNKCIHGMAGLSFVVFHKDRIEELKRNQRAFYFDLYSQWNNLQQKNQLRFTPPVQICYAFMEAIKETLEEGVKARWKRYQDNWQILYDGFKNLGFQFFLPESYESKILLALDLNSKPELDFNDFHDFLYQHQITIYPGVIPECNTFRVAIIGDLQQEDIHHVMKKVTEYMEG